MKYANTTLALIVETGSNPRGLAWTEADLEAGWTTKLSDRDAQGIFTVSPLAEWRGVTVPEHLQTNQYLPAYEDGLVWELRAFFKQLRNGSPEMLEVLFSPKVLLVNEFGELLQRYALDFTPKATARRLAMGGRGVWKQSEKTFDKANNTSNVEQKQAFLQEARKERADSLRRLLCACHMLESADKSGGGELLVHMGEYAPMLKNVRCGLTPNGQHNDEGEFYTATAAWFDALSDAVDELLVESKLRDQVEEETFTYFTTMHAFAALGEAGWQYVGRKNDE